MSDARSDFSTIEGVAAPLPIANLDTDQMMLNLWEQTGLAFTSFHP